MAIGMTVQTISSPVCPATCGGGSDGVDARRRKRRIAIVISPQTIAATAIAGTRKTFQRSLTTRPWSVTDAGRQPATTSTTRHAGKDVAQPRAPAVAAHRSISSNPPSLVRRMTDPPSGPSGRPDRARISIATR